MTTIQKLHRRALDYRSARRQERAALRGARFYLSAEFTHNGEERSGKYDQARNALDAAATMALAAERHRRRYHAIQQELAAAEGRRR